MRIILNSINYDESVQKLFTSLSETIHRTIYRTDIYIKICYFSEYETPKNVCIFVVNTHIACKRNRAWLRPCNFRKRKQELDRPLASLTHDPATLYELKLNTSYFIGNKEQPRDTYVLYVIIAYRLPI